MGLSAGQNWVQRAAALLFGIRHMQDGGTLLVDGEQQPREYDTLNAVFPLRAEAEHAERRFNLYIEPDALTANVPAGRSIYVDAIDGTPDGTPGDEGDPYDTIGHAIEAAIAWLPAADNQIAIVVRPGVYPEHLTGDLAIPSWCKLLSTGGRDVTFIQAVMTATAIVETSPNSALEGFTIEGASGSGGIGVVHAGGALDVFTILVRDCETGMAVSGASLVSLQHAKFTRLTPSETMQTALSVSGGAQVGILDVTVTGAIDSFIPIAMLCDGGIVSGSSLDASFVGYGLYADNGTFTAIGASSVLAANVGLHIGEGGADVILGTVVFVSSITWDLQSAAIAATLRTDAVLTSGLVDISPGTAWTGTHVVNAPDEQSYNVAGRLRVGLHNAPAGSSFGAGDAHTVGMVAYRYDGASTWTDVTAELKSGTGSEVNAFEGTAAGNVLYIGSDAPFPGLQILTTLAMSGGAVACEIYTGSWTALPWMSRLAESPYTSAAQTIFAGINASQVRFGPLTGWVTTAPPAPLPATVKYWWRVRVTSAISVIPRLEQIKLHTTHLELAEDGFTQYFGAARRWRQVALPTNTFEGVGAFSPGDQDLWFGTLGAIGLNNNAFSGTLDEAIGVGVPVQHEVDTSHKLRLRIKQQATSAVVGTVIWRIFTAVATAGSVLTTTSPGPLGDGTPVVVTTNTPGVTGQEFISEAEIDISAIITSNRPTLLIMIQRQGSVDTYNADILVRPGGIELEVLNWADGRPYAS